MFHNGAGSYDVVAPKIKALLRAAPEPADRRARDADVANARRAGASTDHLTEEIGFWEVGFAPVTTSPGRATTRFGDDGFDQRARAVPRRWRASSSSTRAREPAPRLLERARTRSRRFTRASSKAYPCGAGLGLMGVSTDGDVALCHRFAGSDAHKLGTVRDGIDRDAQRGVPRAASRRRQDRLPARAGRGRSARAAAITRRTRATATTDAARTCTTASGFAAGPTRVCRSTASSRSATRRSSRSSMDEANHEASQAS